MIYILHYHQDLEKNNFNLTNMKILLLSDLHWNFKEIQDKINYNWVELIIVLWDLTDEDLFLLSSKNNINKIWINWNHKNNYNLDYYWIEDIAWKNFIYNWIEFLWIPWDKRLLFNNPEKEKLINYYYDKIKDFTWNIIISHFPIFWINDRKFSTHHKWLDFILENINPGVRYYFNWHMHQESFERIKWLDIIWINNYLIINI